MSNVIVPNLVKTYNYQTIISTYKKNIKCNEFVAMYASSLLQRVCTSMKIRNEVHDFAIYIFRGSTCHNKLRLVNHSYRVKESKYKAECLLLFPAIVLKRFYL